MENYLICQNLARVVLSYYIALIHIALITLLFKFRMKFYFVNISDQRSILRTLKSWQDEQNYISFNKYLEYTINILIMMKNKTKQVVFDILEILMFFRICENFGALFLKNIKISRILKTTCFVLLQILISIFIVYSR